MCNGVLHGEFITNVGFGDIKVVEIGNMRSVVNWWNVIDSESDVKCAGSLIANHLLTSWQSGFCAMASSTRKGMCQFITNGGFGNIKVVEVGR